MAARAYGVGAEPLQGAGVRLRRLRRRRQRRHHRASLFLHQLTRPSTRSISILALTIVILGGLGNVAGADRGRGRAGRPARAVPGRGRVPHPDLRHRAAAAGPLPAAGPVGDGLMARCCSCPRGLTRRFGGLTAVDGIDLDVAEGELVSIIGPNGAGKTTLFNLDHRARPARCRRGPCSTARTSPACRRSAGRGSASRARSSTAACSPISA